MPARFSWPGALIRFAGLGIVVLSFTLPIWCQQPPGRPAGPPSPSELNNPDADVDIAVRDLHGSPLEVPAIVRLYSVVASFDQVAYTQGSSKAHFSTVPPGDFEVEVTCPGYSKATERLVLMQSHTSLPTYIYLVPENAPTAAGPSGNVVMSPKLQNEMEKAVGALHKQQFELARKGLLKAIVKYPASADLMYYLGLAELGLKHSDLAKQDFQKALSLDPNQELALVSLGELQLKNGAPADAVVCLQKAVATGRATWRANFQLASAYFQVGRLADAEAEATQAARLAKEDAATPYFLLGEIQYAAGKHAEAKRTWEFVLAKYPSSPIIPETKKMLARANSDAPENTPASLASLPLPAAFNVNLVNLAQHSWAPPDIDVAIYDVVLDQNCKTDLILDNAIQRLNVQLADFEKFAATEHFEHQQIDRDGWPGPSKKHDYSYVVFIHPFNNDSIFLEETRDGGDAPLDPSIPFITTRLNNLGISVLQPFYRGRFNYVCEGISNVRGQAAWQIRFENKPGTIGEGVRRWHRGTISYEEPVKGRIWISNLSYAVLRIESDVREPIEGLELTKDHLLVDYGPVNFSSKNVQLWLPWSADMYIEFRGKRYHDRHFLSDYMLFGVDTTHKIQQPQEPPAPPKSSP